MAPTAAEPVESATPITRYRRRIPSLHPPISPSISTPAPIPRKTLPPAERTRVISEGPTIRGLRVAFEETPVKLRELEVGWRQRRRVTLGELAVNGTRRDEKDDVGLPEFSRRDQVRSRGAAREAGAATKWETGEGKENDGNATRATKAATFSPIRRASMVNKPSDLSSTAQGTTRRGRLSSTGRSPKIGPRQPKASAPAKNAAPSPPHTPTPTPPTRSKDTYFVPPRLILPAISGGPAAPPSPLLASPLPPTNRPVRLTSRSSDTIHVHPPTSPIGITLSLQAHSQTVQISSDGLLMIFSSAVPLAKSRRLDLSRWEKWSEGDKRDWEAVRRLVEGYKRHTPKVRLYLPLGHLTITCSNPPDVLLNFTHTAFPTNTLPDQASGTITKVRVRLSRLAGEITLDTAMSGSAGERLRTKRTIKLDPRHSSASRPAELPADGAAAEVGNLQAAMRDAVGWSEAERIGVERLLQMRDEWERYK